MGIENDTFNYIHSCDLKSSLTIKIGTLEGKREKPSYEELLHNPVLRHSGRNQDCSDLIAECSIKSDGRCIPLSTFTPYKPFTTRWNWNEWLSLPIRYCDLPRNSVLLITIYDCETPRQRIVVGGTSIPLFDRDGLFPRGLHDLRVWPEKIADPVETPGLVDDKNNQSHALNKLEKKYKNGEIQKVDWLDRLAFQQISVIIDQEKKSSNFMYLTLDFPQVVVKNVYYHIVWWENMVPDNAIINKYYRDMTLYDPEISLENLHESKHHHLARSLESGVADRDLKPNKQDHDKLTKVIAHYPPTRQLTSDEQDLLWKYRYYLKNLKEFLPKFLKCVKWNLEKEAEQALLLLNEWSAPDPHEALELLGPEFTHQQIRRYAVERLDGASNEELLLYLLQLVQALRYETWEQMSCVDYSHYSHESDYTVVTTNPAIELLSPVKSLPSSSIGDTTETDEKSLGETQAMPSLLQTKKIDKQTDFLLEESPFANSGRNLASFLMERSCENHILASYFYWYLSIECENRAQDQGMKPESKVREMYDWVMRSFKVALQRHSPNSKQTWHTIMRQQQFVKSLADIMKIVNKETGGRIKKIEKLKSLLADPFYNLENFESLPLPLNPEVKVCGIIAEEATLFKSALEPCKLTFKTVEGSEYIAIFKCGDDLRQDQLIIQIITLMDKLLQNENVDLKLTPYKVLATSSKNGFVQFIESVSIAEVLRNYGSIPNYFKSRVPCGSTSYKFLPQVMDAFIRSCAGYCVITYILGIGDRHFDNILLTPEGHLFHIDFGYILGRDPKPLPPPMKLTNEMVEVMNGHNSEKFIEFLSLCNSTYIQLRRHSSVVLSLFSLMEGASIPDIAFEPDKATKKVEDRFCLSLSEEEAVRHLGEVIDGSFNAVIAVMVEHIHRFTQYMRA
ncbi:Phosphatidylinositol 3-kinase catalytic subunit type 3 [Armadillidium nasatum]|uniref:Phosphatidylinositol 3-kinase catalytic subunit type 3 n=1 Tax=Armadillidium nasatum TaxID=96803 RepID=A0A5N5SKI8_9CRUS|nr:Phosphatidylinositol 3-kinase catalytic subunit type 3 [Armadillidium nasatum]